MDPKPEDSHMNLVAICSKCGHSDKLSIPAAVVMKVFSEAADKIYQRGVADGKASRG